MHLKINRKGAIQQIEQSPQIRYGSLDKKALNLPWTAYTLGLGSLPLPQLQPTQLGDRKTLAAIHTRQTDSPIWKTT